MKLPVAITLLFEFNAMGFSLIELVDIAEVLMRRNPPPPKKVWLWICCFLKVGLSCEIPAYTLFPQVQVRSCHFQGE